MGNKEKHLEELKIKLDKTNKVLSESAVAKYFPNYRQQLENKVQELNNAINNIEKEK